MNPCAVDTARAPAFSADRTTWQWIPAQTADAETNMSLDRELFRQVLENRSGPVLRFYQWTRPALSYGRSGRLAAQLIEDLKKQNWEIVQRPTGGGKVQHGDDLCFTLIWRKENSSIPWPVNESYCAIHGWLKESLRKMGIASEHCEQGQYPAAAGDPGWCFTDAVRNDLMSGGRKIIGGAQWRDRNTALHQGSIQLRLPDNAVKIFKQDFSNIFSVSFGE